MELKRLKEDIKFNLEKNNLDQIKEIEGFKLGEVKINFIEDRLLVELKDEHLEFQYSEFIQNPRTLLNKIMELFDKNGS